MPAALDAAKRSLFGVSEGQNFRIMEEESLHMEYVESWRTGSQVASGKYEHTHTHTHITPISV
jgi:hypothetical protein